MRSALDAKIYFWLELQRSDFLVDALDAKMRIPVPEHTVIPLKPMNLHVQAQDRGGCD